jgi:hypothetical protein
VTGSDAIVLAPWLAFALGVTVICVRLVRSGYPARRRRLQRPDGRRQHCSMKPGAAPGASSRNEESTAEGCRHGARST